MVVFEFQLEYNLELTDRNYHDSRQTNVHRSYVEKHLSLLIFQPLLFRSSSGVWSFLVKLALIVIVFFVIKSYLAGGNRTGATGSMGVGPDRRPPGKLEIF